MNVIKLIWNIIWTGGLPYQSGLPRLPGVPHLHANRPPVFRLRANGRYCWPTTLNSFASICTPCCVFLHVVACCWELLRIVWNRSNFQLRANRRNNSQHCWANNVGSCCVRLYVDLKRLFLPAYFVKCRPTKGAYRSSERGNFVVACLLSPSNAKLGIFTS